MPAPLLLVDDDLATIAQVKRLLARDGYEVVLATNAADAIIAWGHHLPPLVLLSAKVESDRGHVVLEELRGHPDAQLLRVLLLGETIPGFGYPVAPFPLDAETFAQTVRDLVKGAGATSADGWEVQVSPRTRSTEIPAVTPAGGESEEWRATRRSPVPGRSNELSLPLFATPDAMPVPAAETSSPPPDETAPMPPGTPPPAEAAPSSSAAEETSAPDAARSPGAASQELEATLFGDLEAQVQREVEEAAIASVDASLAQLPVDDELQRLEDDVRAEAARRRAHRQSGAEPAVGLPTPDRVAPVEDGFSGFGTSPTPPPAAGESAPSPPPAELEAAEQARAEQLAAESQRARGTLARAEEITQTAVEAAEASVRRRTERLAALELELEDLRRAVREAEGLALKEKTERERLEKEVEELLASQLEAEAKTKQKAEGETIELWAELERVEGQLKETKGLLETRSETAAVLELQLRETEEKLRLKEEAVAALELELKDTRVSADGMLRGTLDKVEQLQQELRFQSESIDASRGESADAAARLVEEQAARQELAAEREALAAELQEVKARMEALSSAGHRAAEELREEVEEAEEAQQRMEAAQQEALQAQERAAASAREVEAARAEAQEQVAASVRETEAARAEAQAQVERAAASEGQAAAALRRAESAEERAQKAGARSLEAEEGLQHLNTQVQKLQADFTAAYETQRQLEQALEEARAARSEVQGRAEAAESRVRTLEEKSVLPLKVPNRPALGVLKFGTVDLGELARLVGQVVLARAELRLELAVPGGRRLVWLQRGAVAAAESSFAHESLLDRAQRDGLIDARQAGELQMVRNASPAETIAVLKERGFIREAEVVPLVQRYTEQVALDAFAEPTSEYRLVEEPPGVQTLAATLPRPTLPLVAEALRRALPVDELLQRLGGSEAVPSGVEGEVDLRALGFADKEKRMLGYCDGEATVEDLALASGLKSDVAFRALLVAKLLGLIQLKVPARTAVGVSPQLDVQRLEAKFEQVQDADYFTMLGLGRGAGGDEVQRAWNRLAEEFDPIKYSGHPDAGLQQRAQVVYTVLEEAARALGDDRRRAEYARHLVD